MLVGFVQKSEPDRIRIVDVDTQDYRIAMNTVKTEFGGRGIVRIMALIQSSKEKTKPKAVA